MIEVNFYASDDQSELSLTVTGHAGQAEPGKDIVCSASSIIAYTVAQVVSDMYKEGRLYKEPVIVMVSGSAVIRCRPKEDSYDDILHTLYVAQTGYRLLTHNFPDYVRLIKTIETDIIGFK